MALATGQFTIVDYNDAQSFSAYISSNRALTQIYNPDNSTYSPNFTSSTLILTPSLFTSANGSTDVITSAAVQSIKWFDGSTEITAGTNYGLNAFVSKSNRPLTIKGNILSGAITAKTIQCEITYLDAHLNQVIPIRASITINRVNNGGGTTIAQITTPNGNIFKNSTVPNGVPALTAEASLLRASGPDITDNTYAWFRLTAGAYVRITSANAQGITGYDTQILTIPPSGVDGLESFRVDITDKDNASGTLNQVFQAYVTVVDQTDPLQVQIISTAGDVLKNGQGSTILYPRVFRSGDEIDAKQYTYYWYAADKTGAPVANFGGAGIPHKVGVDTTSPVRIGTLTVDHTMVNEKAIFTVEVLPKN